MTRPDRASLAVLPLIALAVLLAACSSGAAPAPTRGGLPAASAPAASAAGASVTSAAGAVAAVIAADPRFAGIRPLDPNLIGQCCFSQVQATDTGWTVMIEVGWGDCPAGCIDKHRWAFAVTPAGEVSLLGEGGPAVPAGVPGAGPPGGGAATPSPAGSPDSGGLPTLTGSGIEGIALAGPTCPVVRPDDPACADRPVVGAAIHILAADGVEVATLETNAAGRFAVALEAGRYRVVADPAEGVMHAPGPIDVTVAGTAESIQLDYDTGIR